MNFRLFLGERNAPGASRRVPGTTAFVRAVMVFLMFPRFLPRCRPFMLTEPQYFLPAAPAFPVWLQWRPNWQSRAVCVNDGAAVPAEAAQYYADLVQRTQRVWRFLARYAVAAAEVLFSVLLAPRMLIPCLWSAFFGWEVVWNSPQRDDDSTPWGEAFMRHGSQLLLGWSGRWVWRLDLRFLLPAGADCLFR